MKRLRFGQLVAVLALVALVAAACGGGGGNKTTGTTGGPKAVSAVPGFDGTTITLGVITPTTGLVSTIGNPLTAGNKAYWDSVNARGGVAGKYKVNLTVVDSQYNTTTAVQQYSSLKSSVLMFNQLLGTAINKAILPQLKTDNIVASPASLDADWVAEQNLLPIGAPYQIQALNGISYYVKEGGGQGKKLCTMRQADAYGDAGQAGVDYAAQQLGITLGPKLTFKTGDPDFTAQITQFQSAGCQAIFLVATAADLSKILTTAATRTYTPQWIAQSPTWLTAFAGSGLKDYLAAHFWLVSEGTTWGDTSVPGMKQMLDDVTKYKPDQKPDPYFAFGYVQSWAVHQLLEKAVQLGDLSHQGLINAMNSLGTVSFGGLLGDYKYVRPPGREPPRKSTIFKVDPSAVSAGGLAILKPASESDAARSYRIPGV